MWRQESLTREEDIPQEPAPQVIEPVQPQPVVQAPPRPQPNPEMVAALGAGFGAQMRQILESQSINGMRHMDVTTTLTRGGTIGTAGAGANNANGTKAGAAGTAGTTTDAPQGRAKILVSAGEIVYAQTLTEANTDAPGPVLAQIMSGPLKGSRVMGGFANTEDFLTITFDRVIYQGRIVDVDAIALDVDTTLPGVATDVDNRYFTRIVLPAAAAFVEGFGAAVADSGSTTVSVEGETVTTETNDIDTREELLGGVAEATERLAEFMDEEADKTKHMIKVAAGTAIGILFVDEIEDPNALPNNN